MPAYCLIASVWPFVSLGKQRPSLNNREGAETHRRWLPKVPASTEQSVEAALILWGAGVKVLGCSYGLQVGVWVVSQCW